MFNNLKVRELKFIPEIGHPFSIAAYENNQLSTSGFLCDIRDEIVSILKQQIDQYNWDAIVSSSDLGCVVIFKNPKDAAIFKLLTIA